MTGVYIALSSFFIFQLYCGKIEVTFVFINQMKGSESVQTLNQPLL